MGQATRVGLCHDLKHGMSMNHSALISQRAGDIIWSHAHACELWLDGGNPFWLLYHRERERVHDYSNTHVYKLAPDCLGSVWFKEMSKKFYRIFILWKFSYLHRRTEIFINTSIFFSICLYCTMFWRKIFIRSDLMIQFLCFSCESNTTWRNILYIQNPVGFNWTWHSNPIVFLFLCSKNPSNQTHPYAVRSGYKKCVQPHRKVGEDIAIYFFKEKSMCLAIWLDRRKHFERQIQCHDTT
jgi:hypothetical protein